MQQLRAWSFTQRRIDAVHMVFRGPHGGTVRVLRSLLGRPDAGLVAKAARLAHVDVERFWPGPDQPSGAADEPRRGQPAARAAESTSRTRD